MTGETEIATGYLCAGLMDLAAFERPYIATPDLVSRLRGDRPLADADPAPFYGGGSEGYTDYSAYAELGDTA